MQTKAIDILYSRPGMYLLPYDQEFDAASCFANLLKAVVGMPELGIPTYITMVSASHHFLVHTRGYKLSLPDGVLPDLVSIFDISNFQKPFYEASYPLGLMQPIVWFSEHCLVDMTIDATIYRQAFCYGEPIGQQSEIPLGDDASLIGFQFTLPGKPFNQIKLGIDRLRHVAQVWENEDIVRWLSVHNVELRLHKQWFEQSTYYHSLEITPEIVS